MAKITVNPRFRWSEKQQRFFLASHDGQYEIPDSEILIRADRGVQGAAKQVGKTAAATGDTFGTRGTTEYNAVIPGLVQEAQHPTGYTPLEKSSMITSTGESLGGVNSGATGEARLTGMRTRNASGFAPALAEAARAKGRAAASAGLQINMSDAELARQKQDAARRQLESMYSTDTGRQLSEQELQDEALRTQLAGGQSGWFQNALGTVNAIANLRNAFKPGSSGSSSG